MLIERYFVFKQKYLNPNKSEFTNIEEFLSADRQGGIKGLEYFSPILEFLKSVNCKWIMKYLLFQVLQLLYTSHYS